MIGSRNIKLSPTLANKTISPEPPNFVKTSIFFHNQVVKVLEEICSKCEDDNYREENWVAEDRTVDRIELLIETS